MKTITCSRAAYLALFCLLVSAPLTFNSPVYAAQAPQTTSEQEAMLDINKADAASIAEILVGVGPAKAKEIVAYREMFGSFRTLDELLEVPGIGAATLEKNSSRILITQD